MKVSNFQQESIINLDCDDLYNSTELRDDLEPVQFLHKKSSLLDVNNSIENVPTPNLSRFNSRHEEKPRVCFVQTLYKDDDQIPIQYVDSDSASQSADSPKFIDVRRTFSKGQNRTSQKSIKSFKYLMSSQTEDNAVSSSSR